MEQMRKCMCCEGPDNMTLHMPCQRHELFLCFLHLAQFGRDLQYLQNECFFCQAEEKGEIVLNDLQFQQQLQSWFNVLRNLASGARKFGQAASGQITRQLIREASPVLKNVAQQLKNNKSVSRPNLDKFMTNLKHFYGYENQAGFLANAKNAGGATFKGFFSKIGISVQVCFLIVDIGRDFYKFFKRGDEDPESQQKLLKNIGRSIVRNCANLVGSACFAAIGAAFGILLGPLGALIGGFIGAVAGGMLVDKALSKFKCLAKSYENESQVNKAYQNVNIEPVEQNITREEFRQREGQVLFNDLPNPLCTDEQKASRKQSFQTHWIQFRIIQAAQDAKNRWRD